MTLYNVIVGVVDLIEAPDEATAKQILSVRLTAAGFDTYEGGTTEDMPSAFESEPVVGYRLPWYQHPPRCGGACS